MAFEFRRLPAVPKRIADITDKDIRISILGKVIDTVDGVIIVDDGSGKAEIVSETEPPVNSLVRIFTRVLPLESGYELRAELVQDMSALDTQLYHAIRDTNV